MYTRCPTCSTCFRVTDRHLAIAHGKVRCGQCQLVFNAPEHAIDDLPVRQLTPPVTTKPAATISPEPKPIVKESPTLIPPKEIIPPPIAPTAKEKLDANIQKTEVEEKIEIEPVAKPAPVFDSESTMIADVSTLDRDKVENINLDNSFNYQDTINEDDDDLFNDSFDLNAAIDELTHSTEKKQVDVTTKEARTATEELLSVNESDDDLPVESEEDIFHTDAYDATSASSVADVLNEMEGQMSLDIEASSNSKKTHEEYDVNNEFNFLKLDNEANNELENEKIRGNEDEFGFLKANNESNDELESEKISESEDEFGFLDFDEDDELDDTTIETEPSQKEHFDIELNDDSIEDKKELDDDELFNQIDLSDFEDRDFEDSDEEIVLEGLSFENSNLQNIGQHVAENDVPIQLRKDIEHLQTSQHNWHPALAPSFIVVLLLLSFSQLAFFRAHELVQQIPSSRPMLLAFCESFGCNYSGPRNTKQIQLLSRDVRLHPKQKNALLISAAMINNAYFSQPYPKIHIRLSDISGNVIAERIFRSKIYMGKLSSPFLLMKSKTPVHINFEVVDPGKDAINFEFTFL